MWGWRTNEHASVERSGSGNGGLSAGDGQHARASELPDPRQALAKVAEEFARARRYERPLTVAVLVLEDRDADRPATAASRHRPPVLAVATRQAMREIDIICQADPGRCVVVIPEAGPEEARQAIRRTCHSCAERLGCSLRVGLATYPRDGWTFPDLVEAAERHAEAREEREGAPTPRPDSAGTVPEPTWRIGRGEPT